MKYVFAAALLIPVLAGANDGIAAVGVGGIVFHHTDAIAMKKEVLNVGYHSISVDYEFLNESAADVEETIVFPLPVYSAAELPYAPYMGRPRDFSIRVNDKPVDFHTVVQASLAGVDVTAQLRKAGLSDAQIANQTDFDARTRVPALTVQQRQQLTKQKLFGIGPAGEIGALWDTQVNYVWKQKFPAHQIVRVHHAYKPFVATGPGQWVMDDETAKRYCADPAFVRNWKKLAMKSGSQDGSMLAGAKVAYILKTGNTWKHGIEDFTLNVIKSKPVEVVSLCFPGTFKKIDATTYQVHLSNFEPTSDLDVYFGNAVIFDDETQGQMPVLRP